MQYILTNEELDGLVSQKLMHEMVRSRDLIVERLIGNQCIHDSSGDDCPAYCDDCPLSTLEQDDLPDNICGLEQRYSK